MFRKHFDRLKFNRYYFSLSVILFFIEFLIAKFVHDQIIRPHVGDILVVILIYCFVKSFLNTAVLNTALGVLLFSFGIEILQYFKIIYKLGLQNSKIAQTIIGTSFDWFDLVNYSIGILIIVISEAFFKDKK